MNSRSQLYSGTVYSYTAVQLYRSREILQLVGDSIEQDQIRKISKNRKMYAHAYTQNYSMIIAILSQSDSDINNSILKQKPAGVAKSTD